MPDREMRTVRIVAAYRVRVPADWSLVRLGINNREVTAPPLDYITGSPSPDGGKGTIRVEHLPAPELLTYQHRFEEEGSWDLDWPATPPPPGWFIASNGSGDDLLWAENPDRPSAPTALRILVPGHPLDDWLTRVIPTCTEEPADG